MHGLIQSLLEEEREGLVAVDTITCSEALHSSGAREECRPLWLTFREAESLLVLCAASPVSVGPHEQELFIKLGEFFRECCK